MLHLRSLMAVAAIALSALFASADNAAANDCCCCCPPPPYCTTLCVSPPAAAARKASRCASPAAAPQRRKYAGALAYLADRSAPTPGPAAVTRSRSLSPDAVKSESAVNSRSG